MALEDLGGVKAEAQLDISQVETALKSYSDLLKTVNANMGLTEQGFIKTEDSAKSSAQSINTLTDKIKVLRTELNGLSPDTAKFTETARQLNSQMAALAATEEKAAAAGKGWSVSLGAFTPQMIAANLATRAIYEGLGLLEKGFTEPIAKAGEFQQTMADVSSLFRGDNTAQMKEFSDQILNLSKVVPRDANDLGAGLYDVVSAGFTKTADAMQVLTASSKGAVAGLTDTKTAVDAVTTILNAYQLKAGEATNVTDSIQVAIDDGKIRWGTYAQSIGLVVSTAALAKVPLDQMNAALVSLSLAGQQTSHAATDLNMFLDSVIKASKGTNAAAQEAKALGIEYNTTALQAMGLQKFIQQVADKAGNNDVALQTLTGDVRGFRAVAVLAGSGTDNFNKALDDMTNKAGAADEAFKKNADTLNNDWTLAWNSLNAILIDAGQQQLPGMQSAVNDLTTTINANKDSIESAAGALSGNLVEGMKEVVAAGPAIIQTLSAIAFLMDTVTKGLLAIPKFVGVLDSGADTLGKSLGTAFRGGTLAMISAEKQALGIGSNMSVATNMSVPGVLDLPTGQGKPSPDSGNGDNSQQSGGIGGTKESNKALEDAKKILEDEKNIEKDIITSLGEEAKVNKQRTDALHDELELKKKMGVITDEETRTLDTLNRRVDYQKDAIADATKAWEDQSKVVDDLQKKIDTLNGDITKADDDTNKKLTDQITTWMTEKQEIEDKIANHTSSSSDDDRLTQLNKYLDQAKTETGFTQTNNAPTAADQISQLQADNVQIQQNVGSGTLNAVQQAKLDANKKKIADLQSQQASNPYDEATKLAAMDPLEKIKYEGDQKKADLQSQLTQTKNDLSDAQKKLADDIKAVTDAQDAQKQKIGTSYDAIETRTKAHVDAQVKQLDIEKAHVDALAQSYSSVAAYIADPLNLGGDSSGTIPGHADGGMISGPGTGTSDSILARLSNGEYVMPAAATVAYRPILDAMRSMQFKIPGFKAGGPVAVDSSRKFNLVQHFHGESSRQMQNPSNLRWHSRFARF